MAEGGTERSKRANVPRLVVLVALLTVAGLVRVVPLGVANPRHYHIDEWNFADSAQKMVAERDLDPRRYIHPALYRYVTALVYGVLSGACPSLMGTEGEVWVPYVAGRLVSAAAGVLGVWLVFALARRLMPWGGAVLAAGVLATMPLHVQFSHIAKPDVTMVAWVALTTLLAWRLTEAPSLRLYAVAGLCSGFAVSSKYNGVVACVAIFAAHMVTPGPQRWWRRLVARRLWLAAACSVAGFAMTSPYTFLHYGAALRSVARGYHTLMVAGRTDPDAAPRPFALVAFGVKALEWVGAVPLALAAAGAVLWWRRNRRVVVLLGSAVVATLVLISAWTVHQAFYLLPLTAAVATLAPVPVVALWRRRRWLGHALVVACLAPSVVLSARELVRFRLPDTRQLARQWLLANPRARRGAVLRDYDSLWDAPDSQLTVKNPGFHFYQKVDRAFLKDKGVTHFVLSDSVASTDALTPAAARRKQAARRALLDRAEFLTDIPTSWWREGPGIKIYRVKESVLRAFEAERQRRRQDLTAKVAAVEHELARRPDDVGLHMEAGRRLCRLATVSHGGQAVEAWRRAERHFAQAAEADPTLADARYNRGCVYLRVAGWIASTQRDKEQALPVFGRAVDAFRAAIDLDPQQADYYFNLGYALWCWATTDPAVNQARQAQGTRMYRQAAALDPSLSPPDPHVLAVIERGPRPLH